MNPVLWTPSPERVAASNMTAFRKRIAEAEGVTLPDYAALHDWSVRHPQQFWPQVWDFCGLKAETLGERVLVDGNRMPGAQFFPDAKLNFAENLMRRNDDARLLSFWGEDKVKREMTAAELHALVSRLQQYLRDQGIGKGDRVAGFVANTPETLAAMLAVTSLGAVWSSCSPDFGVAGVLDRFGQVEPKLLFACDGYYYNGKGFDSREKLGEIIPGLPTVQAVCILPYLSDSPDPAGLPKATPMGDAIGGYAAKPVEYVQVAFNDPLVVMFSSGTTGKPKCIAHSIGGALIQQVKEHVFHCDVKRGDVVFYFTTCGWMMWNWLIAGLAADAELALYDGSPFAPDGDILYDYADAAAIDVFGTSAKYIDACAKFGLAPKETHKLDSVRLITSTGSPLAPESFDYVYDKIKTDVQLSSISGGTDIVSCFVLGEPTSPVRRGEIQARGLGMAVEVWSDDGRPVIGEKGELVCTRPFPSMPIGFWGDDDGSRYRAAYFETYPNIWRHGDYVELTPEGGLLIHGRSDAVLNPGGVRIGTAEIYRQVEKVDEVVESIVIGQDWDGDVRVVLFVRLRDGVTLDEALEDRIKKTIRANATPRHVPAKIVQVADIPRTRSGKIVELAVRDIVHGRSVKNVEALANPEALKLYEGVPSLQG